MMDSTSVTMTIIAFLGLLIIALAIAFYLAVRAKNFWRRTAMRRERMMRGAARFRDHVTGTEGGAHG